jgi:putative phosphoesterase
MTECDVGKDPGFGSLCVSSLRLHLAALQKEMEGVLRDDDPENVHRMRVASRRVRADLDVFEQIFPKKKYARWKKDVRGLTRMLGSARDADVQIGYLEQLLKGQHSEAAGKGLEALLGHKRAYRSSLQPPLAGSIGKLKEDLTIESLTEQLTIIEESVPKEIGVRTRENLSQSMEHVQKRVEEVLGFAKYVDRPLAMAEHHAMRIASKRLRYTLEIFQQLYDDGLKEEISEIKRFQDVLGKMHDCDVWINEIQAVLRDKAWSDSTPIDGPGMKALQPGLRFVLDDCNERKTSLYQEFVLIWSNWGKGTLLNALVEKAIRAADLQNDQEGILSKMLVIPPTKIALLGDVHGNFLALEAALTDARSKGATVFLNTGDQIGYGPFPEEVVRLAISGEMVSVVGNYDQMTLSLGECKQKASTKEPKKQLAYQWAYDHLSAESRKFLKELPREVRFQVAGTKFLLTHGSPTSLDEALGPETSEERLAELARSSDAQVIIVGHAHRPMVRKAGGTLFVNAGTIGRPDDGDPRATYAIMTLEPLQVEYVKVDYDVEATVKAVREEGLPEEFAQMIIQGLSFDHVVERGRRATAAASQWPREDVLKEVRKVAEKYRQLDRHTEQVTKLALELFDQLRGSHKMKSEDRFLLECASILHDIGWSAGTTSHHKNTLALILSDTDLPLTDKERSLIGAVARYHTRSIPKKKHAHYASLRESDRIKVSKLAALLRIADGLDATHSSAVEAIDCAITKDHLTIKLRTKGDVSAEKSEAMKKGDLFQKAFHLDVVLEENPG